MKNNNKNKIPIKAASLMMSATMVGTAVPFAPVFANVVKDDDSEDNNDIVIDTNDLADTSDNDLSDSLMTYGIPSLLANNASEYTMLYGSTSERVVVEGDDTVRTFLTNVLSLSDLGFNYNDKSLKGCQLVRVDQETDAYVKLKTNDYVSVTEFNYDKYRPTSEEDFKAHQLELARAGLDPTYTSVEVPCKSGEYSKVDMDTMSVAGFWEDVDSSEYDGQRYAILSESGSLIATIGFKTSSNNTFVFTSLINQVNEQDCTITFTPGMGTFNNGQSTNTSKYSSSDVIGYFEYGKSSLSLDGYKFRGWKPKNVNPVYGCDDDDYGYFETFGDYMFLKKDVTFVADFVEKDPEGTRYEITYKFVGDDETERGDIVVESDKIGVVYKNESDKTGSSDLSFLGDLKGYEFVGLFDGVTPYDNKYEVGTVVEEPTTVYVHVYLQFIFVVLDDNGNEVTSSGPISWSPYRKLSDYDWEIPEELFRISDTGYKSVVDESSLTSSFVLNKNETYKDKPTEDIRVIGSVGNAVGYNIVYLRQHHVPTVPTYNLTFDANGGVLQGDNVLTREENDVIGKMPTVTRDCYDFAGWYTSKTGGMLVTEDMPVTKDETYYAHWTIQGATVSFDMTGGYLESGSDSLIVPIGTSIGTLPTVVRNGYAFDGWYTEPDGGTKITESTVVTSSMTVYARWSENTMATVTFDGNGGTSAESYRKVKKNSCYGTLPMATRSGYTFAGWYTEAEGGTRVNTTDVITESVTLYAHWTVQNVVVSFDMNGGDLESGSDSKSVAIGSKIGTLPVVSRYGYKLVGWYTSRTEGTEVTADTLVTGAMTVYARWVAVDTRVTVTFDANGGIASETSRKVEKNSFYTTLPVATRDGYTFRGWYTGKENGYKVKESDVITGSLTLYARWDKAVVANPVTSLTLNKTEMTVDYGEDLGLSYTYAPLDADNVPCYWTSSDSDIIRIGASGEFLYVGAGDVVLTVHTLDDSMSASVKVHVNAAHKPITNLAFDEPTQTVVLDEQHRVNLGYHYGPVGADNATFTFSSDNPSIISVSEDGRTWAYGGSTGVVHITMTTTDGRTSAECTITVNAKKNDDVVVDIYHNVTLNYGDGTVMTNQIKDGETYDLEVPTRDGYTFDGWYLVDGTKVTELSGVVDDVTVYAHWTYDDESMDSVTLIVDAQNGNPVVRLNYEKGQKVGTLSDVTRDGYVFSGWYDAAVGGKKVTSDTVITKTTTIYAHWIKGEPHYYNLTLDGNGGRVDGKADVMSLETKLVQNDSVWSSISDYMPVRQGYTFAGWFDSKTGGNMVYDADGNSVNSEYWSDNVFVGSSDISVYAHWVKNVDKFTLKFDVRGGNVLNDVIYDADTHVVAFPEPTRAGFTFKGWYDSVIDGNLVESLCMTDDVTLYAYWEKNAEPAKSAYIVFDTQCDEIKLASMTVDIGTDVQLPTLFRDDYTFDGWYTDPEGGNRLLSLVAEKDITLYAHWTAKSDKPDVPVGNYHITFDCQDGSKKVITEQIGTAVETFPTVSRTGYTFDGWYTKSEGGTQVTSYDGDKDVTFYAHWKKTDVDDNDDVTFLLNFDTQGGALIDPAVVKDGSRVDVFPVPVRDGYTFDGWYSESNGGEKVSAVIMQSDTTIYAHWIKNVDTSAEEYVVTLDDQNGNVRSYSLKKGTAFTSFTTPVRDGYTFDGWYDAKTDGTKVTSYDGDKDVTFYAHWIENVVVPGESEESDLYIMFNGKKVSEITLTRGDSYVISYYISPSQAVRWESSNESVIKVADNKLRFTGVGETILTVKSDDNKLQATCKVTVLAKADDDTDIDIDSNIENPITPSDDKTDDATKPVDDSTVKPTTPTDDVKTEVYNYKLNITTATGAHKLIKSIGSDRTVMAVTKALGYTDVAHFTVKTTTSDETTLKDDVTLKEIADLVEKGNVLIVGMDVNGNPLGSAKIIKVASSEYNVLLSKDTNVSLDDADTSKDKTDTSDTNASGEAKKSSKSDSSNVDTNVEKTDSSDDTSVSNVGKSDTTATPVKTSETTMFSLFGGMGASLTAMLSSLAFWKKKH